MPNDVLLNVIQQTSFFWLSFYKRHFSHCHSAYVIFNVILPTSFFIVILPTSFLMSFCKHYSDESHSANVILLIVILQTSFCKCNSVGTSLANVNQLTVILKMSWYQMPLCKHHSTNVILQKSFGKSHSVDCYSGKCRSPVYFIHGMANVKFIFPKPFFASPSSKWLSLSVTRFFPLRWKFKKEKVFEMP